jgi:type 1 fimbria pilin
MIMIFSKINYGLRLSGLLMLLSTVNYAYAYSCNGAVCDDKDLRVTVMVNNQTCYTPAHTIVLNLGNSIQSQRKESTLASTSSNNFMFYDCASTGYTQLNATWSGTADTTNSTYFSNTGTATGVALKLTDLETGKQIIPNKTMTYSLVAGDWKMDFRVDLIQTAQTATKGSVNSNITVAFFYE